MIPILTNEQIKELDSYTINKRSINSIDLMEIAAREVFFKIAELFDKKTRFSIFCGMGNNGGDGLALSRLLLNNNYSVITYIVKSKNIGSEDFEINLKRLKETNFSNIVEINSNFKEIEFSKNTVIIDSIYGTGLNKQVSGFEAELIKFINNSKLFTISIDVPSGISGDLKFFSSEHAIIKANITYSFQFPKLCFLLPDAAYFCGDWYILDIKLLQKPIEKFKINNFFVTEDYIKSQIHKRDKFSHKGNYGHSLLICGSKDKGGAAILAAKACLRTGCGLLTCHSPSSIVDSMRVAIPEAMFSIDENANFLTEVKELEKYDALAVGPGIGTNALTVNAIKLLIQNSHVPLIIDADALNIISDNKTWLSFLKPNSILTPHPKEFNRLFGSSSCNKERLEIQRKNSIKYQVFIILKGSHTCITTPDGNAYFNSTGNPGMATAGSGDVLTGMLCGLLAQSYSTLMSSLLGVYLHGLSGDIASEITNEHSLIASDIISNIGNAYKHLINQK